MAEGYLVPDLAPGEIYRVEDVIRRSRFIATFARVYYFTIIFHIFKAF